MFNDYFNKMSLKRKTSGLVISWQRSFSILAPWRRGRGGRDAVLESEVVLTKMKIFNNFCENDSISTGSASEHDMTESTRTSEANPHVQEKPQTESGSDYLSVIFSSSQLPRLFKFESEDSGVELPSGANSPSTPTGSEQSFVVHSRESSCDSCNMNPEPSCSPDKLVINTQNSSDEGPNNLENDPNVTEKTRNEFSGNLDQSGASGDGEKKGQSEETRSPTARSRSENEKFLEEFSTRTNEDDKSESVRRSATRDSLEDYMEECCRISQAVQQTSSPLGSGLGYLEHICQLLEKIGHLQELNLQLQRQVCGLQKDGRMTKTKEDFFQQHCSCGAATLAFQVRLSRGDLAQSGHVSDLSTIPEVSRHPLSSTGVIGEHSATSSLRRKRLGGWSSSEGEDGSLWDNVEASFLSQRRLGENYTWGRVKDIMKKTKLRNQSRLGMTSASLKMSCPQLYRPDLDPEEAAGRNRKSMIALSSQHKLDFWIE
uniref:Si:ch211-250c4.3 n=1 Tax=Nothobranchius kuhntae TaxID=321403 RepID=A0A1A8J2W6_NOTKU